MFQEEDKAFCLPDHSVNDFQVFEYVTGQALSAHLSQDLHMVSQACPGERINIWAAESLHILAQEGMLW